MKPPCMVVVRYILPAIRAQIAKELVERYGLKRSEVAKKMVVTPAAVTQYLEGIRGGQAIYLIEGSEKIAEMVSQTADSLVKNDTEICEVLELICNICQVMMSSGLLCEMHQEMLPSLKGRGACDHTDQVCPLLRASP